MAFHYQRTIHFPDTDAAGVVFFARYLAICHEAYEEALGAAGIELHSFFSSTGIMVPIARSEADYRRPLVCGDRVRVSVQPERLGEDTFAVAYEMVKLGTQEKRVATARTVHVCISSQSRQRCPVPDRLAAWVDANPVGS